MITNVLAGLMPQKCLIYLDGQNQATHLTNLESVFQRVRDAGLTLNPLKCKLIQKSVQLLGYLSRASQHSLTKLKP